MAGRELGDGGGVCSYRRQASVCMFPCKYARLDAIASMCVRQSEGGGRVTFGSCCSLGCMRISGLMFM